MAKHKKSKHYNKNRNVQQPNEKKESTISDAVTQEILDDLLECSGCCDIGVFKFPRQKLRWEQIEYYIEHLPAVDYVLNEVINYIFSNGITTGNAGDKDKLNEWLYRKNDEDTTNYDVLKSVIRNTMAYGECGIRWFDGNIYMVKKGRYAPLVLKENGLKRVLAWVVSKKCEYVPDFKYEKDQIKSRQDIIAQLDANKTMLLDKSEFINIRLNMDDIHGKSPFENDKLRLELLAKTYERLNYDVEYDGAGRIIIRPKDGYVASEDNDISTSTVINNSVNGQKDRAEKAKEERTRLAKEIKNSSSDAVILMSNAFDKDITHLPRVTKATEFFGWMDGDVRIVCQVLGIDPYLVGMGKDLGNNSSEKIIDNGMLNSIIPLREKFAVQFSEFIAKHLGFEKLYFDKYKMEQQETDTDKLEKYVNMMYKILIGIEKKDANGGNKEGIDALLDTALSINELVRNSLYDASGNIKSIDEL